MASQDYVFSGIAKWAKVREPTKPEDNFGKEQYEIVLYMNEDSLNLFKESGSRLHVKEDDEGTYVKFTRPHVRFIPWENEHEVQGPPSVSKMNEDGDAYVPFEEGLIGNGSKVNVRVSIYNTRYGKATELQAVAVDDLVEYEAGAKPEPKAAAPTLPF